MYMVLSCVQDAGQPQTGTYEQTVAFLRVPPKWGYFDQLSEHLFAPWHVLRVLVVL